MKEKGKDYVNSFSLIFAFYNGFFLLWIVIPDLGEGAVFAILNVLFSWIFFRIATKVYFTQTASFYKNPKGYIVDIVITHALTVSIIILLMFLVPHSTNNILYFILAIIIFLLNGYFMKKLKKGIQFKDAFFGSFVLFICTVISIFVIGFFYLMLALSNI